LPFSHFAIFPFRQYILFCFNTLHKMDHSILEKIVISGPFFIDLFDFGWGALCPSLQFVKLQCFCTLSLEYVLICTISDLQISCYSNK
jgi:hypothetical protein